MLKLLQYVNLIIYIIIVFVCYIYEPSFELNAIFEEFHIRTTPFLVCEPESQLSEASFILNQICKGKKMPLLLVLFFTCNHLFP